MVQISCFSTLYREFHECFTSSSWVRLTCENFREYFRESDFHENFQINFLKGISWDICFKLLSSSPKPLFLCFYIKTQLNSSVFHSINISKVIFNSFHCFWSLDYVFGGFMFLVEIFSIGVGKLNFCQSFWLGFDLNDNFLWMLAPCGKNNMYLGKIFICLCIV